MNDIYGVHRHLYVTKLGIDLATCTYVSTIYINVYNCFLHS